MAGTGATPGTTPWTRAPLTLDELPFTRKEEAGDSRPNTLPRTVCLSMPLSTAGNPYLLHALYHPTGQNPLWAAMMAPQNPQAVLHHIYSAAGHAQGPVFPGRNPGRSTMPVVAATTGEGGDTLGLVSAALPAVVDRLAGTANAPITGVPVALAAYCVNYAASEGLLPPGANAGSVSATDLPPFLFALPSDAHGVVVTKGARGSINDAASKRRVLVEEHLQAVCDRLGTTKQNCMREVDWRLDVLVAKAQPDKVVGLRVPAPTTRALRAEDDVALWSLLSPAPDQAPEPDLASVERVAFVRVGGAQVYTAPAGRVKNATVPSCPVATYIHDERVNSRSRTQACEKQFFQWDNVPTGQIAVRPCDVEGCGPRDGDGGKHMVMALQTALGGDLWPHVRRHELRRWRRDTDTWCGNRVPGIFFDHARCLRMQTSGAASMHDIAEEAGGAGVVDDDDKDDDTALERLVNEALVAEQERVDRGPVPPTPAERRLPACACEDAYYVLLDVDAHTLSQIVSRLQAQPENHIVLALTRGSGSGDELPPTQRVKFHEIRGPKFARCIYQYLHSLFGPLAGAVLRTAEQIACRRAAADRTEGSGQAPLVDLLLDASGRGRKDMRSWPYVSLHMLWVAVLDALRHSAFSAVACDGGFVDTELGAEFLRLFPTLSGCSASSTGAAAPDTSEAVWAETSHAAGGALELARGRRPGGSAAAAPPPSSLSEQQRNHAGTATLGVGDQTPRRLAFLCRCVADPTLDDALQRALADLPEPAASYVAAAAELVRGLVVFLRCKGTGVDAVYTRLHTHPWYLTKCVDTSVPLRPAAFTAALVLDTVADLRLRADLAAAPGDADRHVPSAMASFYRYLVVTLCIRQIHGQIRYNGSTRPSLAQMNTVYGAFYWDHLHADPATQAVPKSVASAVLQYAAACGMPMATYGAYTMDPLRCKKRRVTGARSRFTPWADDALVLPSTTPAKAV